MQAIQNFFNEIFYFSHKSPKPRASSSHSASPSTDKQHFRDFQEELCVASILDPVVLAD